MRPTGIYSSPACVRDGARFLLDGEEGDGREGRGGGWRDATQHVQTAVNRGAC
jgi:hypothetical protein